eukprot:scaffold15415_cov26-Tisochrysis_lutea.AAC.2
MCNQCLKQHTDTLRDAWIVPGLRMDTLRDACGLGHGHSTQQGAWIVPRQCMDTLQGACGFPELRPGHHTPSVKTALAAEPGSLPHSR